MQRLVRLLDRCAQEGRPARFWLRDDDAVEPTAALDRLLGVMDGLPVTLAVIPAFSGAALAGRLAGASGVSVAAHGWAHRNHAGAGEKTQELGAHRPVDVVLGELAEGVAHLAGLHGRRFVPLLVPPWNRIAPEVTAGLPGLGFRALSVFGPERPGPIREVNAQVDVIDWRGTRGGRDEAVLVDGIMARIATGGAVGMLTHHLVHDVAVWAFLERLVDVTRAHPGCRWVSVTDLLG
jgi:peptidoglycan/xylan/chitin deacetylase (PgdA/CDA1 family)